MKFHVKTLILLITAISPLHAEQPERYGFLNVVNMIPSSDACEVHVANKCLVPNGLMQGVETGWFMVPIGKHSMAANHSTHKKHSTSVNVADGESQLLVIFLQGNEKQQANEKPSPPQISVTMLPAYESTGFALKAVSTLPETNQFQLAREAIELGFLKITDVPKWTGGGFVIQHKGNQIGIVNRGRERCSNYLLMSTDHMGKYLTALVNADTQQLPPWMKTESTAPQ